MEFSDPMKKISILGFIATSLLWWGCTEKMPLPPEPSGEIPPESTYTFISTWGENLSGTLMDLEYGADGYLYVLDSAGIHKFFGNGTEVAVWPYHGTAIDFGSDHTLWIAAMEGIYHLTLDGTPLDTLSFVSFPELSIAGLVEGENQDLFLTLPDADLVLQVQDTLVDTLSTFGSGILYVDEPRGLAFQGGWLYVAVPGHNWVEVWDPYASSLQSVLHLGGLNPNGDTSQGMFRRPLDVAVDENGFIYVADSGNARVQVFRPDGSVLTVVDLEASTGIPEAPIRLTVSLTGKYLYVLTDQNRILKFERVEKPPPPPDTGGGGG